VEAEETLRNYVDLLDLFDEEGALYELDISDMRDPQ